MIERRDPAEGFKKKEIRDRLKGRRNWKGRKWIIELLGNQNLLKICLKEDQNQTIEPFLMPSLYHELVREIVFLRSEECFAFQTAFAHLFVETVFRLRRDDQKTKK